MTRTAPWLEQNGLPTSKRAAASADLIMYLADIIDAMSDGFADPRTSSGAVAAVAATSAGLEIAALGA